MRKTLMNGGLLSDQVHPRQFMHVRIWQMVKINRLKHGTFIYHPQDMIGALLDRYGEWAERELSFLLGLIGEGDVVVDVGAHIGTFTVPFARKVGPQGVVVAIEPQRFAFQNLTANLVVNGLTNVWAYNVICSRERYFLGLVDVPGDRAKNTGGFRIDTSQRQERKWNRTRAEPLDEIVTGLHKLALLKIDVEGFEQDVLGGGRHTIQRLSPLIHCECLESDAFDYLRSFAAEHSYRLFAASFDHRNSDNFFKNPVPAGEVGLRDTNVLLWPTRRSCPDHPRLTEVATFEELKNAPMPSRAS